MVSVSLAYSFIVGDGTKRNAVVYRAKLDAGVRKMGVTRRVLL